MSLQYLRKELSPEVNDMHTDEHISLSKVVLSFFIVLASMLKLPGKFAISLWHLKKVVTNDIRNLTALADSSTTLTIYYLSNVLPPLTLSLSQYGIHTNTSLFDCLCKIRSLFQVMVGPSKLACLMLLIYSTYLTSF